MARVSIAIPAHNAARFLPQTIESVQTQTTTEWALIVVDDGSEDETADIACCFADRDRRIRVVRQPNAGVASARNRGLAESSTGEYVIFLDADDVWEKDALESLQRSLNAHPQAAAASGLSRIIDSRGQPLEPGELEIWGRRRHGVVGKRLAEWPVYQPTSLAVLAYRNCIYTPGQMLIRRSVLEAVGAFDAATSPCEDWDMSLRLSLRGDIAFVDRVVLNWRTHGGNASAQTELLARQMLHVRRKLLSLPELSAEQRQIILSANWSWGLGTCRAEVARAKRALAQGQLRRGAQQLRSALEAYLQCTRRIPIS